MPNKDKPKDSESVDKEEVLKQARILWQKYFALTKELLKFSGQEENNDLFIELVNQRERLINKMRELPENDYRESEECQKLIEQILPMDKQIIYRAKAWLNRSRRQNSMVRSYDLMESAGLRGSVLSRKY